jgi:hypothetical protein
MRKSAFPKKVFILEYTVAGKSAVAKEVFILEYIVAMKSAVHYTVKKVSHFPVSRRDVTYQTLPGRE